MLVVGEVQPVEDAADRVCDEGALCFGELHAAFLDAGPDGLQLIGQLVDVRITESHSYTLRGELVAGASALKRAS